MCFFAYGHLKFDYGVPQLARNLIKCSKDILKYDQLGCHFVICMHVCYTVHVASKDLYSLQLHMS